ncbi:hypothetical protein LOAG_04973, partial [Loa loa]
REFSLGVKAITRVCFSRQLTSSSDKCIALKIAQRNSSIPNRSAQDVAVIHTYLCTAKHAHTHTHTHTHTHIHIHTHTHTQTHTQTEAHDADDENNVRYCKRC